MTVKQLHDLLESYMKCGIGDGWQLNDVELDKQIREERCNTPVLIVDDGMKAKFIEPKFTMLTQASEFKGHGIYKPKNVFGIVVDVMEKSLYA